MGCNIYPGFYLGFCVGTVNMSLKVCGELESLGGGGELSPLNRTLKLPVHIQPGSEYDAILE